MKFKELGVNKLIHSHLISLWQPVSWEEVRDPIRLLLIRQQRRHEMSSHNESWYRDILTGFSVRLSTFFLFTIIYYILCVIYSYIVPIETFPRNDMFLLESEVKGRSKKGWDIVYISNVKDLAREWFQDLFSVNTGFRYSNVFVNVKTKSVSQVGNRIHTLHTLTMYVFG